MDGTILSQGSFIAPATIINQIIQIPSQADWVRVMNYTQFGTTQGGNNVGVEFYWQRGMAAGTGIVKYYATGGTAAALIGDTLVSGGFTLYDPTGQSLGSQAIVGNAVATTASTNATRPVVSTASTAGIAVGTVVRMSNTAQTDVNGIDMVVGAVTLNTSFTLLAASNALATAPGAIGGAGFYRIINADNLFYPRRRYVTNITKAANAQVSTSVAHGLTPGQEVDFNIPSVSGMVELNPNPSNNYYPTGNASRPIVLTIVDAYNFTINTNTSAMTTFTWPTISQQPAGFPQVVPFGEDTATSLSSTGVQVPLDWMGNPVFNANTGLLADSVVNTGYYGMILGTGGAGTLLGAGPISGPAGQAASDVIYWTAGKSTLGGL